MGYLTEKNPIKISQKKNRSAKTKKLEKKISIGNQKKILNKINRLTGLF